jgi:hypothetical protein
VPSDFSVRSFSTTAPCGSCTSATSWTPCLIERLLDDVNAVDLRAIGERFDGGGVEQERRVRLFSCPAPPRTP